MVVRVIGKDFFEILLRAEAKLEAGMSKIRSCDWSFEIPPTGKTRDDITHTLRLRIGETSNDCESVRLDEGRCIDFWGSNALSFRRCVEETFPSLCSCQTARHRRILDVGI